MLEFIYEWTKFGMLKEKSASSSRPGASTTKIRGNWVLNFLEGKVFIGNCSCPGYVSPKIHSWLGKKVWIRKKESELC